MIEKPKKQLSNLKALSIGTLLVPLIVLFVLITLINPSYLFVIAIAAFVSILFLVPLRNRLDRKYARVHLEIQNFKEKVNLVEAETQRQETVIKSFKKKIVNYSQLKGLTEQLGMCLNLDETSKTLSAEVNKLFGDKDTTVILYLFHSKTGELGLSSSQKGQMRINLKSKKGDHFDRWIVKALQPLFIEDTKTDYRFDIEQIKVEDARIIRSLIGVPLIIGNKALGILRIDSPNEQHFTTEDLRLLTAIGDLGAVAVENAQLYERVEQLAIKDGLTGLYLRQYVMERFPEEIARHLKRKKDLSLIMFDLDNFKQYNDKFGHMAGDIVLRTVGVLLMDIFNEPGTLICRYGGEEFAVILTECSKKKALDLAEKLRSRIEEQDILLRRERTHTTISVGVATFPKDAHNPKELIHKADTALYKAKSEGKNRVCTV